MAHTLFSITLYLFIGSLLMLLVNELVDGAITKSEFLQGMALWPAVVVIFCLQVLLAYVRRVRKAFSRG
jgi:hypothetical protein